LRSPPLRSYGVGSRLNQQTGVAGPRDTVLARFEVHANGDAIVVAVIGDIDSSNALEFRCAVSPELMQAPASFVIDCGAIEFVDSAGLQVLLTIVAARQGTGSPCVLLRPGPRLVRLLEITETTDLFTIQPTTSNPSRCTRQGREQSTGRARAANRESRHRRRPRAG
jgi:anti-anti-sigma factor